MIEKGIPIVFVLLLISLLGIVGAQDGEKEEKTAGNKPEEAEDEEIRLISSQIRNDMLYGTDDYFGEWRDVKQMESVIFDDSGEAIIPEGNCPT